mmetsp:Transcript_8766/g.12332  ORF Transcript_8766/g.12332 Transcript_8766/m.12332 type:complete len:143 (+) Transcript_8766:131-559(+)
MRFATATLALVMAAVPVAQAGSFKQLVVNDETEAGSGFLEVRFRKELFMGSSHYGDPSGGCEEDEVAVRIQGVGGAVCSPKCDGMECPTDVPDGCEATPQCLLQDAASGSKYCALACRKGTNCGEGASCKILFPGIGLCTYD